MQLIIEDFAASPFIGACLMGALASMGGMLWARLAPWSSAARAAGIPLAFGLALGPFFTGLAIILPLALLGGHSGDVHLATAAIILLALACAGRVAVLGSDLQPPAYGLQAGVFILSGLLVVWIGLLIFNAISQPVYQNDTLEYLLVGRELFLRKDLSIYPLVDSAASDSGFYGPWSHPPLYVSLIYLANLLQGQADQPGVMRLIAPWFALVSTGLVVSIGRMYSLRTGLLGALIFVSTPLFFLGAGSGLIDALPVCGVCLILALLVATDPGVPGRAIWLGAGLGLMLWTHSQAVLFIPLVLSAVFIQNGLTGWKQSIYQCGVLAAVAALFAVWPYARNCLIYGYPINDTSPVFDLPQIDWQTFIRVSRTLDFPEAVIQYGLFKGWVIPDAFGLTFWLGSVGAFVFILSMVRRGLHSRILSPTGLNPWDRCLLTCLAIWGAYFTGVLLSVFLGINLMVQNERYLLVTLPFVSVLAGFALECCLRSLLRRVSLEPRRIWSNDTIATVLALGVFAAIVQMVLTEFLFVLPRLREYSEHDLDPTSTSQQMRQLSQKLAKYPNLRAAFLAGDILPLDAVIFTLRPSDLYYTKRKMVSAFDPRALSVYEAPDAESVVTKLRELGVTHLHVPNYSLPMSYNTGIGDVLKDPRLTSLVMDMNGNQFYELRTSGLARTQPVYQSENNSPWSFWNSLRIGLVSWPGQAEGSGYKFFHRDIFRLRTPGTTTSFYTPTLDGLIPVEGCREVMIDLLLQGSGMIRLFFVQFDDEGSALELSPRSTPGDRIDEWVVNSEKPRNFSRRVRLKSKTRFIRIVLSTLGHCSVHVESLAVFQITGLEP